MPRTLRSSKFQESDSPPYQECKNLRAGVKGRLVHLFETESRKKTWKLPVDKSKDAFTPRQRMVTPLISKALNHLISNVENHHKVPEKPVSPNLAILRMTPGQCLQQKREILQEKHLKAKSSVDKIPVGGGVSLWPEMDNMRLSKGEVVTVTLLSLLLCFSVFLLFKYLHGPLLLSLDHYARTVRAFHGHHPIISQSGSTLNQSLVRWHKHFWKLMDDIQRNFETSLHRAHVTYILYVMMYIAGIGMLLYYLVDNMIKKSRLTPKRTKIWVTLLMVTSTWTFLMIKLLVAAHHLERGIEGTVYRLIEELAELATSGLDLRSYHNIVTYWRFRCLPPTTRGTLYIFGLVKVHDVSFYFQYYSLPIITALCTPVIKLLLALKDIYSRPRVS
eukprot:gi/632949658/ref/XP_007890287.1/ PREDICTED: uncharacterized protein LOC103177777 [Callorhinchus milii]